MADEEKTRVITEFRDGIFALRTRRFGNVAEIMIKKLWELNESDSLAYDKKDLISGERIEIKFATVMKKNEDIIREDNVVEQCLLANIANRAMLRSEANEYDFDCNIQQVKRKEFDILFYGLFFADEIEIFEMKSESVLNCEGYSDKQHRGNEGEGQFHVTNKNIQYHRDNYLKCVCTYEELYDLFTKNVKPRFWSAG